MFGRFCQEEYMATHPYISGTSNLTQMIGNLRRNFPATVTSETVKKYGIASNNESYIINALQFLGIIDDEGKRTTVGQEVFSKHDDGDFKDAFGGLVERAYKELFDLHGDGAWHLNKGALISYFRSADKTSDVIGGRQASVFQAFRGIAGREPGESAERAKSAGASKATTKIPRSKSAKSEPAKKQSEIFITPPINSKRDFALTVRVEINLPAEASAETYDNIFKSIKANLMTNE